ncbi:hypothetical protein MKW98_019570 [Papaver atlanticum]|uniref:Uncharacterized protein n=1 Tax=Papaver atlanticum TaxID=357466 RepID=A0AAD4S9L0_9MAGN|nr:hypothetical protein MKW98_019570 [Papaver atlanticum]
MAPKRKRTTETCLGARPGMISDEDFMILDARWSNISEEEIMNMPREEFMILLEYQEAGRLRKVGEEWRKKMELSQDEKRLAVKQLNEAKRRELIQAKEMNKYFRKNRFDEKSFHEDIQSYGSLYVFCVSFAKLESPTYKDFMESLANDHDNYKVYFAPNKSLAYSVGLVKELTPEQQNLKPGDRRYKTKEFDTGLHEIGIMLDADNYGVLLTNKTEDEVLSKFCEYREFDFINAGSTPMETLVFEKDEVVLPLPPFSSAKKLFPKLKKLGMPVELIGKDIKLTERFVVCEVKKRVTEKASKILVLLDRKMFNFVLLPVCYWSRTTKETKYFPLDLPSRQ